MKNGSGKDRGMNNSELHQYVFIQSFGHGFNGWRKYLWEGDTTGKFQKFSCPHEIYILVWEVVNQQIKINEYMMQC